MAKNAKSISETVRELAEPIADEPEAVEEANEESAPEETNE